MRLGSLCSGAGGLDMAVEAVFGATTVWHCEQDAAASRVLAHRWPGVPNHGDLIATDWSQVEPVDIVCAGWPCQPFSLGSRPEQELRRSDRRKRGRPQGPTPGFRSPAAPTRGVRRPMNANTYATVPAAELKRGDTILGKGTIQRVADLDYGTVKVAVRGDYGTYWFHADSGDTFEVIR